MQAQIAAGVDAIMLFDTWGGLLGADTYPIFSLHYMRQVLAQLPKEFEGKRIPKILFTKGGAAWLEMMPSSGCDAVGVDWTINIGEARRRVGAQVAIQGNLDPAVLYASPGEITSKVQHIIKDFGSHPGHVFNLGHGIYPDVKPEAVSTLIEAVHKFSIV